MLVLFLIYMNEETLGNRVGALFASLSSKRN